MPPRKNTEASNAQGETENAAALTPLAAPASHTVDGGYATQPDETLPGDGSSADQAQERGTHLRVLAPFVHYRVEYNDPFLPAEHNPRLIEQTAYQGQLIDVEALPAGEADRVKRLHANPGHYDVEEVSGADAVVLPPQTRRMVGVATGAATAESLALQAAAERTSRALQAQFRPGDPEYEVSSADRVPAGSRFAGKTLVPAGPGGYNDEAIEAAGADKTAAAYDGNAGD
jgi:hypothetical protein